MGGGEGYSPCVTKFVILLQDSFAQPILFAVQDFLREAIALSIRIVMKFAEEFGDAEAGGGAEIIRKFANFG